MKGLGPLTAREALLTNGCWPKTANVGFYRKLPFGICREKGSKVPKLAIPSVDAAHECAAAFRFRLGSMNDDNWARNSQLRLQGNSWFRMPQGLAKPGLSTPVGFQANGAE